MAAEEWMSQSRGMLRTEQAEWRQQMMHEERAMAAQSREQRAADRQNLEAHMNSVFQQRTAWNEQQLEEGPQHRVAQSRL